ncbi:MAG: methyltransferase domain-containing protein, partial [Oscillospiraceae bacterium]|nr:methyltransferase domain-containing protein [Oscillospiraceae bacterium]
MNRLEQMADFFTARLDGYDEHMINDVEGCKEGYAKMAQLIPCHTQTLLDLGCGTGLELDEIFKLFPAVKVTGVDMTQPMLDELKRKHPDKNLNLICGDYFKVDFGKDRFDC